MVEASPTDPTSAYARAVVAGEIVAGRLVKLAAARHLRDLAEGPARGLRWDAAAAQRVIDFFAFLTLPDADRPFTLEPPQAFIVGSLFGWKRADGFRRFRSAYVETGKGSGKTPLAAGIGLYGLVADGERAAEVYSAATKEEQAAILFRDAKRMVEASPHLAKRIDVGVKNLAHLPSGSFFRPLSAEHRGLSGPRPHFGLIDELHEHPGALVIDKLRHGVKGRSQPLMLAITNSGHDRTTVCWTHHEYSEKVLDGRAQDDAWFAYVCTLDACAAHHEEGKTQPVEGCPECDDWRDEKVWPKANPLLGVTIRPEYLREQVKGAQGRPTEEGLVKRLNFCLWTETRTAWLPVELWSRGASPVSAEALRGAVCCGGLDTASKIDVAALVLCFPDQSEPGQYTLLPHFWIPEATAAARQQADGIPWTVWARQGLVTLAPGDVIHPDAIEEAVKQAHAEYDLREVAYDPWNATQMALHLQEHGITMIEFAQNLRNFNEPTKQFEALLRNGKLVHGGHPVLDWMAGNVVVLTDNSGNVRPVKPAHSSPKKVDGITAGVMALARALLHGGGESWSGSLRD